MRDMSMNRRCVWLATVTFDVPDGALSARRLPPTEFVKEMRVSAALRWYSQGNTRNHKALRQPAPAARSSSTNSLTGVTRLSGVEAMRDHREGRLTLKTREVQPIAVPPIDANIVRETREALRMARHVFAFKIGVNPRTLER